MKHLTLIACGLLATIVYAENTAEARKAAAAEREKARAELLQIQDSLRREREARYGRTRTKTVELTETEKALDLDSFAGFKFGTVFSHIDSLNYELATPFRAFSRVQLTVTPFEHRLCGIRLYGNISEWDAQSITNEVNFLRKMLSSQYGITTWDNGRGGFFSPNGRLFSKFKNENISISITGHTWLSLDIENLRVKNEDARNQECAKKAIAFPSTQDFSSLERIVHNDYQHFINKKQQNHVAPDAKIVSGFHAGAISSSDKCTVTFNGTGERTTIKVCTRIADTGGPDYTFLFRTFTIAPDGRILSIGEESYK